MARSRAGWVLLVLLSAGCSTRHVVKHVTKDSPADSRGVAYALPRTVVRVDMTLVKLTRTSSPILRKRFEGVNADTLKLEIQEKTGIALDDIFVEEDPVVRFAIVGQNIVTEAEIDPDQIYSIQIDAGSPFRDTSIALKLTEGRLAESEAKQTNQAAAIAAATFEAAAKVAAAFAGLPSAKSLNIDPGNKSVERESPLQPYYTALADVRKARIELLASVSGSNLDTFQFALEQLDREEAKILSFFTGDVEAEQYLVQLKVRPEEGVKRVKLFRYAASVGFEAASGARVQGMTWRASLNQGSGPKGDVMLFVTPSLAPETLKPSFPMPSDNRTLGYRYRIPMKATLSLRLYPTGYGATAAFRELQHLDASIAQLGYVAALPAKFKGRSSTIKPTLSPETGELLSLDVGTTAIDPAPIVSSLGTIQSLLEADAVRRAAAEAAKDPVVQMQREVDALEVQKKLIIVLREVNALTKTQK